MSIMLRPATHTVAVTSKMSQQQVHRIFAASVLIKGVDGVVETIGGAARGQFRRSNHLRQNYRIASTRR
jgi:uncharacterized membrane protein